MSTTVLLVRHTDVHNPGRLFYGRLPRFGLSDLGRRQAEFVADYLAQTPTAGFYSSPLLRARQTVSILASRRAGAPLRLSRALIEVRTGWMGRPEHELPRPINLYEPPHGAEDETIADVWIRVRAFVERLVRRHRGEALCCVSHGDPIVIAHAGYRSLPLALASIRGAFYPQKGSVTTLRFGDDLDRPRVEYRDVIGELAPELKAPY